MTAPLDWTAWAPIDEAVQLAPRTAGVYDARLRHAGAPIYVGSAGDRRNGVSARLRAYAVGKTPDSGLAGKAANRALADPAFCRRLVHAAETGSPWTVSQVAVRALDHLSVEVRSAATRDYVVAEAELIQSRPAEELWNIRR